MNTLTYDNVVAIAADLPHTDVLSLCSSNKQYYNYCHQPNFYYDLINLKYGIKIPNATYADLRFIEELENITLILPDRQGFEIYRPDRSYDDVIAKAEELLDLYKITELEAHLKGKPIYYFIYPQSYLYKFGPEEGDRFNGVWFSAHTPEGAFLKYKDYYGPFSYYGDYLIYLVTTSKVFPVAPPVTVFGQIPLFEDSLKDISKGGFIQRAALTSTITPPTSSRLTRLIETDRPKLDQDPTGIKLKDGYKLASLRTGKSRYVTDLIIGFYIEERENNSKVGDILQDYYSKEVENIGKGVKRYFVVNPKLFYPNKNDNRYVKDLETMTGTVIVAASPGGAILRLINLVPASANPIITDIDRFFHMDVIVELVLTSNRTYSEIGNILNTYLIEIKEPVIV